MHERLQAGELQSSVSVARIVPLTLTQPCCARMRTTPLNSASHLTSAAKHTLHQASYPLDLLCSRSRMLILQKTMWEAFSCSWRQLRKRQPTSKLSCTPLSTLRETRLLPCCKPALRRGENTFTLPDCICRECRAWTGNVPHIQLLYGWHVVASQMRSPENGAEPPQQGLRLSSSQESSVLKKHHAALHYLARVYIYRPMRTFAYSLRIGVDVLTVRRYLQTQ